MQTSTDMAEKQTANGSPRVLVAWQNAADHVSLAGWLEREGFEVMTANGEREALQIAGSSWQPDVVLLDLTQPEVEGFSVCERIRAKNQRAVIFALSDGSEDDEVRSLEAGADDYLSKPFSPEVLLAHVRAHLRSRREPADPRVWRPLARCEKLRYQGKG